MPELQLILVSILALFVAWNLGANDVANSMGTSVGSKALTLRQALVLAGVLELVGAILFGQAVASALATEIVNPALFVDSPQTLLLGMVAVLLACGLWLQGATRFGLPVASSHATVGAIAGFSWAAAGPGAVSWSELGQISLGWVLTPVASGLVAAGFYAIARHWILTRARPLFHFQEWIPWLSALLFAIFGIIVFPILLTKSPFSEINLPPQTLGLGLGGVAAASFAIFNGWRSSRDRPEETGRQDSLLERGFGRFQVMSACFVAFAHGSNDVGNAIAPLAAIAYILQTQSIPQPPFSVPLWILAIGGLGLVAGLAVQGKNVIATVGEEIIALQPSSGFCAELATAATILLASRFGLPVSTSHALVGAVVGIGLLRSRDSVRFGTLKSIALAWVLTLPAAAGLSAIGFMGLRFFFTG